MAKLSSFSASMFIIYMAMEAENEESLYTYVSGGSASKEDIHEDEYSMDSDDDKDDRLGGYSNR